MPETRGSKHGLMTKLIMRNKSNFLTEAKRNFCAFLALLSRFFALR